MRIFTISAALAALLSGTMAAQADGMYGQASHKNTPAFEVGPNWSGFYLGAGLGIGSVQHDVDADVEKCRSKNQIVAANSEDKENDDDCQKIGGGNIDSIGGDGAFGTLQVGYDRKIRDSIVFGAFFDYDFTDIDSKIKATFGEKVGKASLEQDDMWTVGLRLGYLVNPSTLVYGLIGYSESTFEVGGIKSASRGDSSLKVNDLDVSGLTLGAGMETHLHGNWFLKGEYRYTQFDSENLFKFADYSYCHDTFAKGDVETTLHTARVALSYKFDLFGHETMDPLK